MGSSKQQSRIQGTVTANEQEHKFLTIKHQNNLPRTITGYIHL